jgi:hypothetical protein
MKVAGVFSKDAREPIVSTVSIKGDRMMRRSKDRIEVIDLASETMTSVDLQKKTYSVITFAQLRQMMEDAMKKMEGKNNSQADIKWKVSANSTGNTKNISGHDTKEMALKITMEATDQKSGQTGAMVVTSYVWVAANVPGHAEMRDFQKRMAAKLAWSPGQNMLMANPQVANGMAEAFKEVQKLDGAPVLMITSMGPEGTAPPAGTGAAPQEQQRPKPNIGGALGGALGGKFGIGKKKQEPQPEAQSAGNPQGGSAGSLIDMITESSNFSTAVVDASLFDVPAGFKKVDPPKIK